MESTADHSDSPQDALKAASEDKEKEVLAILAGGESENSFRRSYIHLLLL
jgi:hypothetical protein